TWTRPPPMPVWDTLPHQIPPSLRRLPAWRLLRAIRLDDETVLPLGWQWNPRLINRGGDQRFHVGMCQLAGRLHLDEASLLSRSPQKPLRVGQLRPLTEVQRYTGGARAERHDAIDPSVRRRIADDEGVTVVVRQFVGGRESLAHRGPDRSKELLILRIKLVDVGPEPGPRRAFLAIGFHCHRTLPVVLSSSASDLPGFGSPECGTTFETTCWVSVAAEVRTAPRTAPDDQESNEGHEEQPQAPDVQVVLGDADLLAIDQPRVVDKDRDDRGDPRHRPRDHQRLAEAQRIYGRIVRRSAHRPPSPPRYLPLLAHTAAPPPPSGAPAGSRASSRYAWIAPRT